MIRLFILGVVLGLITNVMAETEDTPGFLKDGVIKVHTKKGKPVTFSSNKWKVVPRTSKRTKKVVHEAYRVCKKNRIALLGGIGYNGLTSNERDHAIYVTLRKYPLWGLYYSREIYPDISLGFMFINNDTQMGSISFDF